MKTIQNCLTGIYQNGLAVCLEFDRSHLTVLQPGQFMLVRGNDDILPVPLFPSGLQMFQYTSPLCGNDKWNIGETLTISFPHGKGFDNTEKSKRILMVSDTYFPLRLFPPAGNVIREGGEAALLTSYLPDNVPPEIELLSPEQLPDAINWADCIVGDTSIDRLGALKKMLTDGNTTKSNRNIQILIDTPMVCAGRADCGVCAVKTRHGWKHACTDGPVFQLADLEI